ncbi:MAG: hypothetical protein ACRDWV_10225 [Acidimicrobiales bacterium]
MEFHALESDPVFAMLPSRSTLVKPLEADPAHIINRGFGGKPWVAPTITEDFSSELGPAEVFAAINASAMSAGWVYIGVLGWQKDYPEGFSGELGLMLTYKGQPYFPDPSQSQSPSSGSDNGVPGAEMVTTAELEASGSPFPPEPTS